MEPWPFLLLGGVAVGVFVGLFGVGGSSVATPVLSMFGASGFLAVASPLPATVPAAAAGALAYARLGEVRWRAAGWSLLGGLPTTVAGALLSRAVGGGTLVIASGLILPAVGVRVMLPILSTSREAGTRRRHNRPLLVAAAAAVGLLTGLLANGGGFLLVPLYLLVFGLPMRQAVGTSLVVVAALAMPTLAAHWALGHVDWRLAGEFAGGLIPGTVAGGHLAHRVQGPTLRRAFGLFLVVFGVGFTLYRIAQA